MNNLAIKTEFLEGLKASGHEYSDEYLYDLFKQMQGVIVQLQSEVKKLNDKKDN